MDRDRLRRIGWAAAVSLILGLGLVSLLQGVATSQPLRLIQTLAIVAAGGIVIFGPLLWLGLRMAGWSQPESEAEFEALVQRTERLAAGEESEVEGDWDDDGDEDDALGWSDFDPHDEGDFDLLVRAALDDLPAEFARVLDSLPVVVSDGGRRRRAYGLYQGDTVARDNYPDRILIFRDTLTRDFGHDPEELRAQVTRTVRHEIAHHLGWDEDGVRDLGL